MQGNLYHSAMGGIFQGVIHQVVKHPAQLVFVAHHRIQFLIQVFLNVYSRSFGAAHKSLIDFVRHHL
jgi:hypothetical protein